MVRSQFNRLLGAAAGLYRRRARRSYAWRPPVNAARRIRRVAIRGYNMLAARPGHSRFRAISSAGRRRLFIGAALRNPRLTAAGRQRLLAAYNR